VLTAVSCEGSYRGAGLEAVLHVDVCRSCIHPTAVATVGVQETGAQRPGDAQEIAPLPAGTPTEKLTRAEQRQARRARPAAGERFTAQLDLVEFPGVTAGSRALAPALATGCGTGDLEGLLQLPGSADLAVRRLLAQSPQPDAPQGMISRAQLGDLTSTSYRYAYYTTITVVDGPSLDHPVALVEWCND
jgi:hypothetical protein